MTSRIERLRALEKDLREAERQQLAESRRRAAEGNDETAQAFCNGKAFGLNSAAQRIAALIAELGQEVGAVAEMPSLRCRSDACANKGQVHNYCTPRAEATPVGCIHPDTLEMFATDHKAKRVSIERWGQLRELEGYLPLYTSPAHTSEARDAVADATEDLFAAARVALEALIEHGDATQVDLDQSLRKYDAAMGQEGGNG